MGIGLVDAPRTQYAYKIPEQGVATQPVGSTIVEPWLKPPLPPPPAPNPLAAIAEGALSLLLPVAAFAGTFFGFAGAAGDANESKAVQNFNTGVKTVQTELPNTLPFTGGQLPVQYRFHIRYGSGLAYDDYRRGILGPIGAPHFGYNDGGADNWVISTGQGDLVYRGGDLPQIYGVEREDGQPDHNPTVSSVQPSGYTGSSNDPNPKKLLSPNLSSAIGWGSSKPVPTNVSRAALGLGNAKNKSPSDLLPPVSPDKKVLPPPIQSPSQAPTPSSPIQSPPKPFDDKKAPFNPTAPYSPNPNDLTGQIASIGAILGTINANTTDIKNNTTPENQQFNAKTGSCQAMNSPSCTKGFEDRIKDPINANVDSAKAALAANQIAQDAAFVDIAANFTKVKTFLDNTIVDRAIGVANFAMNVHTSLMLSNALGKTLAGIVDTAMGAAGFQFTNTSGQTTTASRAFTSNVSALIVNLIGQDLYTELTDDWKVANRIYQSGTNLMNKTERLLSGQSKIAQKSGIDVANIGNALRANGIVNPNSYPPMAATKEANTPTELLIDVNTPLASIQAGVKNLNSVTKDIAGTVKQVSAIQKEFGKLADLTNKESKVRKSLRTQSANQAKVKAKFTLLQIKQIKATGQK